MGHNKLQSGYFTKKSTKNKCTILLSLLLLYYAAVEILYYGVLQLYSIVLYYTVVVPLYYEVLELYDIGIYYTVVEVL